MVEKAAEVMEFRAVVAEVVERVEGEKVAVEKVDEERVAEEKGPPPAAKELEGQTVEQLWVAMRQ